MKIKMKIPVKILCLSVILCLISESSFAGRKKKVKQPILNDGYTLHTLPLETHPVTDQYIFKGESSNNIQFQTSSAADRKASTPKKYPITYPMCAVKIDMTQVFVYDTRITEDDGTIYLARKREDYLAREREDQYILFDFPQADLTIEPNISCCDDKEEDSIFFAFKNKIYKANKLIDFVKYSLDELNIHTPENEKIIDIDKSNNILAFITEGGNFYVYRNTEGHWVDCYPGRIMSSKHPKLARKTKITSSFLKVTPDQKALLIGIDFEGGQHNIQIVSICDDKAHVAQHIYKDNSQEIYNLCLNKDKLLITHRKLVSEENTAQKTENDFDEFFKRVHCIFENPGEYQNSAPRPTYSFFSGINHADFLYSPELLVLTNDGLRQRELQGPQNCLIALAGNALIGGYFDQAERYLSEIPKLKTPMNNEQRQIYHLALFYINNYKKNYDKAINNLLVAIKIGNDEAKKILQDINMGKYPEYHVYVSPLEAIKEYEYSKIVSRKKHLTQNNLVVRKKHEDRFDYSNSYSDQLNWFFKQFITNKFIQADYTELYSISIQLIQSLTRLCTERRYKYADYELIGIDLLRLAFSKYSINIKPLLDEIKNNLEFWQQLHYHFSQYTSFRTADLTTSPEIKEKTISILRQADIPKETITLFNISNMTQILNYGTKKELFWFEDLINQSINNNENLNFHLILYILFYHDYEHARSVIDWIEKSHTVKPGKTQSDSKNNSNHINDLTAFSNNPLTLATLAIDNLLGYQSFDATSTQLCAERCYELAPEIGFPILSMTHYKTRGIDDAIDFIESSDEVNSSLANYLLAELKYRKYKDNDSLSSTIAEIENHYVAAAHATKKAMPEGYRQAAELYIEQALKSERTSPTWEDAYAYWGHAVNYLKDFRATLVEADQADTNRTMPTITQEDYCETSRALIKKQIQESSQKRKKTTNKPKQEALSSEDSVNSEEGVSESSSDTTLELVTGDGKAVPVKKDLTGSFQKKSKSRKNKAKAIALHDNSNPIQVNHDFYNQSKAAIDMIDDTIGQPISTQEKDRKLKAAELILTPLDDHQALFPEGKQWKKAWLHQNIAWLNFLRMESHIALSTSNDKLIKHVIKGLQSINIVSKDTRNLDQLISQLKELSESTEKSKALKDIQKDEKVSIQARSLCSTMAKSYDLQGNEQYKQLFYGFANALYPQHQEQKLQRREQIIESKIQIIPYKPEGFN